MFDGLEQARDLDEICSLLLSEKTDPPLPDSPYIIATLRSDHTSDLKPVLQQVSMNELLYVLLTSIPIARSVGILLSLEQGTGAGTAGETAEAKAAALAN